MENIVVTLAIFEYTVTALVRFRLQCGARSTEFIHRGSVVEAIHLIIIDVTRWRVH